MTLNQAAELATDQRATALTTARWIHHRAGAVRTYLFGSRARGDHHQDSNIDILIITGEPQEQKQLDVIREDRAAYREKRCLRPQEWMCWR